MKVGDQVKCIDTEYKSFLDSSPTLTISKIFADGLHDAKQPEKQEYIVNLEEFGAFMFPEKSFEVIAKGEDIHLELKFDKPKPVKQHTLDELSKWRDRLIQADNNEDARDVVRCNRFLDFFLDKLSLIIALEKETGESSTTDAK